MKKVKIVCLEDEIDDFGICDASEVDQALKALRKDFPDNNFVTIEVI